MKIIDGDLLDAFGRDEIDVLFHVANQHAVFGSGIALSIKNTYPRAYHVDCVYNEENGGLSPLGTFSCVMVAGGQRIFNIYGQEGIGCDPSDPLSRNCRYDAFYDGVYKMFQYITTSYPYINWDYVNVGCPYNIASCRAGGDFTIILAILESLEKLFPKIQIMIYKLENFETNAKSSVVIPQKSLKGSWGFTTKD